MTDTRYATVILTFSYGTREFDVAKPGFNELMRAIMMAEAKFISFAAIFDKDGLLKFPPRKQCTMLTVKELREIRVVPQNEKDLEEISAMVDKASVRIRAIQRNEGI